MTRWIVPLLVFIGTVVAAWHATLTITTFGLMEGAVRRISAKTGLNVMAYGNLASPTNQPIVRPSPDLAYSTCPFNLSAGPLLINVVPVAGRYNSLSVFDGRTDVVFVRNDVQADGKPFKVVIALAEQRVPAGVETVRVKYSRGIALIRLLLADPDEITQLDAVRRQSNCASIRS